MESATQKEQGDSEEKRFLKREITPGSRQDNSGNLRDPYHNEPANFDSNWSSHDRYHNVEIYRGLSRPPIHTPIQSSTCLPQDYFTEIRLLRAEQSVSASRRRAS